MTTFSDAVRLWVGRDFSAIPSALLERAYKDNPDDLQLLAGGERHSDCCDSEVCNYEDTLSREECVELLQNEAGIQCYPHETLATLREAVRVNLEDGTLDGIVSESKPCVCTSCERPCAWHWAGGSEGWLPMWGTLWTIDDPCDRRWFRDNLEAVADCGFLVYESDETDLLIGIDGAGYDFYSSHWEPLYRARGLQWHDAPKAEKTEENANA